MFAAVFYFCRTGFSSDFILYFILVKSVVDCQKLKQKEKGKVFYYV